MRAELRLSPTMLCSPSRRIRFDIAALELLLPLTIGARVSSLRTRRVRATAHSCPPVSSAGM